MMNRNHTTSGSYNHSSMSFAALEASSQKQQQQQQQQQHQHHNLWDYETSTQTLSTHQSYPFFTTTSHFLDCTPPLLPMATTLPFYSPPPQPITTYQDDELLAIGGGGGGGSIGLNLGRRTYFPSGDALALGRLWGRSRGGYAFGHHPPPRCQADGCGADLSGAKHYHRRHKVCEFHSKAAVVFFAGGVQQRFCQQCSRFHELSEFDEAKRSCRKRLADHNRRRRKHKSQPSTSSSSAPKNNSTATSSSEKAKLIAKSSRDTSANNKPSSKPSMAAQQIHQKKDLHLRNDPSLSLGGIGRATTSDYVTISESKDASQHLQSHFSNDFFHSQGLLFPSPNEASQSTANVSDMSHHHHHQSSLLQLGQAMFNMDFICSSKENRDFI